MATLNEHFLALSDSYLFVEIARRIAAFKAEHPERDIIRLGIGDVTRPLCPAVVKAMHEAVEDQAKAETFHGYGPEAGYAFLREAIVEYDYKARGIDIKPNEVFVNDGAKSDTGNIGDILGIDNRLAMTDPIYPVYVDSNVMCGRSGQKTAEGWSNIQFSPCTAENGFLPSLPDCPVDMIYLCYPNNPTGTVLTREQLKVWVDYAREHHAVLLYDSAYERYIRQDEVPHSIYEIEGAKEVAIEFRSYSKTAGFTGVRCGYTVVPEALCLKASDGREVSLNRLWLRRQSTKFNGASYISQKAAAAIYTPEGRQQVDEVVDYYMTNASLMREAFAKMGWKVYGGVNAPYLWVKTPDGMDSWTFFDRLLNEAGVVGTPGVGFGPAGEGYFRFTAFGKREDCLEAIERIRRWQA